MNTARIVGPLEMPGLTDSVAMHIGSMSGLYENMALPDGFLYRATDGVQVFVTDTAIYRAWAAQDHKNFGNVESIVREPAAFTSMFDTGAGDRICADIPGIRGALTAMLIEYSQDPGAGCKPNYIAVSVVSGHRLIAAQKAVSDSAAADTRGMAALAQALVDRLTMIPTR